MRAGEGVESQTTVHGPRPEILDQDVGAIAGPIEERRGLGCFKSSVTLSLLRLTLRKYALSP